MKHNQSKINKACEYLAESHNAEFAPEYGEPGYANPEFGVILANWNNVSDGLADWLETVGYSLEWSDEWTIVDGKAYRTEPDSYSWESSLILTDDGEYLTREDSPSDILECLAMSDRRHPVRCVPSWVSVDDIKSEGYSLFRGELESGHHAGQTDNPESIAREAFGQGAERVIFRKVENSQFYVRFECYALFPCAEWDRFDICAAYARLESDYNVGGILRERGRPYSIGVQLHRMQYRPGASDGMTPNAWAVYRVAESRLGLTS